MLTAILIVAALVYVLGFFWASRTVVSEPLKLVKVRTYSAQWQASIYQPLAKLEGFFTGTRVLLDSD